MNEAFEIRPVQLNDAQAIADIYNYYITDTIITFELETVDATEIAERIHTISASFPFFVATIKDTVVGYAYANTYRKRAAYNYTVETSIYLKKDYQGKGMGKPLYMHLLNEVEKRGFRCAIGGIGLPNDSSVAFHEACGFTKVGVFKEVGFKLNRWVDVGYWQKLFH